MVRNEGWDLFSWDMLLINWGLRVLVCEFMGEEDDKDEGEEDNYILIFENDGGF